MSTALARVQDAPTHTAVATLPAPMDFGAMMALSEQLVSSGFLPDHIKRPAQAVAIILAGQEMGLPPMRALRSLQMVKGKITESADSQLGRFKAAGGRAQFKVLTETEAELYLVHPNGDTHTERFTLEDAKRAGLAGPQSMYAKYPKPMLRSRAITGGLKSVGWDGGAGVYDPSELQIESAGPSVSGTVSSAAADSHGADDDESTTLEEHLATAMESLAIEDAREMKVGPQKKAVGTMSRRGIKAIREWAWKKATEVREELGDYSVLIQIVAACDLVDAEKAKEEAKAVAETTPATAAATTEGDDESPF